MRSKKPWMIIAAIVIIIVLALVYVATTKNTGTMSHFEQSNETQINTPTLDTATPNPGVYTDYSPEAFATAEGRRWLFFFAAWCPQCRALESDIKASGVPAGVTILKVDYDAATDLKKKYGVALQTTIVEVDDQGNKVGTFVAYDEPTVAAVRKALGD